MQKPETPERNFIGESRKPRSGLVGEIWAFLVENRKWWLLPILAVLLLFGLLLVLGGSAAGPFIYPLF